MSLDSGIEIEFGIELVALQQLTVALPALSVVSPATLNWPANIKFSYLLRFGYRQAPCIGSI